jgi:hypothetical protein
MMYGGFSLYAMAMIAESISMIFNSILPSELRVAT